MIAWLQNVLTYNPQVIFDYETFSCPWPRAGSLRQLRHCALAELRVAQLAQLKHEKSYLKVQATQREKKVAFYFLSW
jgi:hypothetical protein